MAEKVVVGMSGGVDSSVAALLLKEQGYDVIGVTMQIWQPEDPCDIESSGGCCGMEAVEDARKVASVIGIPHYVMNFREIFKEKVIDYFTETYCGGMTPNPCIACNRYVKWEALLEKSLAIGASYLATGHYARVGKRANGRYAVELSGTPEKDQTYALYSLTQEQLSRTLFPLGSYSKEQVRQIAEERRLPVAHKNDSQDICFVPDHDYASFIEQATGRVFPEGNFVDSEGRVLGRHKGIIRYTVGQRKKLGLSLGRPCFVLAVDPGRHEVVIGFDDEARQDEFYVSDLNFMAAEDLDAPVECTVKIRYNHKGTAARIEKAGEDLVKVKLAEAQRGVSPGQSAVFYLDNYVLGGGIICKKDLSA